VLVASGVREDSAIGLLERAVAARAGGERGLPMVFLAPGESDAVPPAVGALAERSGWQAKFVPGFGGIVILVSEGRLSASEALSNQWAVLDRPETLHSILAQLEAELAASERTRAQLEKDLHECQRSTGELQAALSAALDQLDSELDSERDAIEQLGERLGRIRTAMLGPTRRVQSLERRLMEAEALQLAANRTLDEERAWVAEQARLVGSSQAWRMGHRLVRLGRMMVFRRDRGTDAFERIVARMERETGAGRR
jgi:hypothetical protein